LVWRDDDRAWSGGMMTELGLEIDDRAWSGGMMTELGLEK